jgi:hypothetical protein
MMLKVMITMIDLWSTYLHTPQTHIPGGGTIAMTGMGVGIAGVGDAIFSEQDE